MATIYLSSTYDDFKEHRKAVFDALRMSGHQVIAMEDYVARDDRPLKACLEDVAKADIYVGLFGLRYGYVPPPEHGNAEGLSITELELRQADRQPGTYCLIFLLDEDGSLPGRKCIDQMSGDNGAGSKIDRLRRHLQEEKTVTFFDYSKPDALATAVQSAVAKYLSTGALPNPEATSPDAPAGTVDPAVVEANLRRYFAALAADCQVLPLQLFDAGEGELKGRINLPQVYVPLHVVRPNVALKTEPADLEARYRTLTRGTGRDRNRAQDVLAKHPVAVLIGDPGSGKSAFVNGLALRLLEPQGEAPLIGRPDDDPLPPELVGMTPVRIILRQVEVPVDAEEPRAEWLWQALEADVRDRLKLTLAEDEAMNAAPTVARALRQRWGSEASEKGCFLLLDGLDEVPEAGRRRENLIKAVQLLITSRGKGDRVLVTARPYAYAQPRWQLVKAPAYVLAPFDERQRALFWERWYNAARADLNLTASAAKAEARQLTDLVEEMSHVRELAERPLLATMLVLIYQKGNRLPPGRVELYKESVDLLVSRWRSGEAAFRDGRGGRLVLPDQALRDCLAALALNGHRAQQQRHQFEGTADLKEDDVLDAFRPLLRQMGTDELLNYLRRHTGILVAREEGRFSFPHRSFQEYLAMQGLKYLGTKNHLIPEVHRDPVWWREVFLLAVAEQRGNRDVGVMLLEWLLRAPKEVRTATRHRCTVLAGMGLLELDLDDRAEGYNDERDQIREALLAAQIPDGDALESRELDEAEDVLCQIGDSRPGVGLTADGIPDIDWVEIPGGEVNLQGGAGSASVAPFQMSRYLLTNAQFQAFVDAADGYANSDWWDDMPSNANNGPQEPKWAWPNHPRENVSWYDAVAFCRWLSVRLDIDEVRLPTEFEWQQAATGGDPNQVYPWGKDWDSQRCNTSRGGLQRTTAVGIFLTGASTQGVLDLSGNLWEWCLNKYHQPGDAAIDVSGKSRVVRGGSWYYDQDRRTRADYRNHYHPLDRLDFIGFRVLCSSPIR